MKIRAGKTDMKMRLTSMLHLGNLVQRANVKEIEFDTLGIISRVLENVADS